MRWIVASLISINLLAFVYFQFLSNGVIESASQPEASQLIPAGTQTIRLLSEQPVQKTAEAETTPVKPQPLPEPKKLATSKPICTLVGAFEKLLRAEYFLERLITLGLEAEIKELSISGKPDYWLYLTPEVSRKEALRRLSELQRQGIDSYVIPSGDLANGISLGVFSERERALALQAKVRERGYQPKIADKPRQRTEIWIRLPRGEAARLGAEGWSDLLVSDEYLQKRQAFCDET